MAVGQITFSNDPSTTLTASDLQQAYNNLYNKSAKFRSIVNEIKSLGENVYINLLDPAVHSAPPSPHDATRYAYTADTDAIW